MAIEIQTPFKPLPQQHYTLAETQAEKDAAMARQMTLDNNRLNAQAQVANMQEANQNSRAGADLSERARQANIKASLDEAQNAETHRQNDLIADYHNRSLEQSAFQADRAAANDDMRNQISLSELALNQQKNQREADKYDIEKGQHEFISNIGNLGFAMHNSRPDANGVIDITAHRSAVDGLLGGQNVTQGFQSIKAQNTGDGRTQLIGVDKDGKEQLLSKPLDNGFFQSAAQYKMQFGKKSEKGYAAKVLSGGVDKDGNPLPDQLVSFDNDTGQGRILSLSEAARPNPEPKTQDQAQQFDDERAKAFASIPRNNQNESAFLNNRPKQPALSEVADSRKQLIEQIKKETGDRFDYSALDNATEQQLRDYLQQNTQVVDSPKIDTRIWPVQFAERKAQQWKDALKGVQK